jgi:hypothetical protein
MTDAQPVPPQGGPSQTIRFLIVAGAMLFVTGATAMVRQASPSAQAPPTPASGSFD